MVLSTSAQSSSRSSGCELLGRGVGERVRMSVDRARLVQSRRDQVEDERWPSAVSDVRARVGDAADGCAERVALERQQ